MKSYLRKDGIKTQRLSPLSQLVPEFSEVLTNSCLGQNPRSVHNFLPLILFLTNSSPSLSKPKLANFNLKGILLPRGSFMMDSEGSEWNSILTLTVQLPSAVKNELGSGFFFR